MRAQYRAYSAPGEEGERIAEPAVELVRSPTPTVSIQYPKIPTWILSTLFFSVGLMFLFGGLFLYATHYPNCSAYTIHEYIYDPTAINRLFDHLNATNMKDFAREYSSKPHIAGSDSDIEYANRIEAYFKFIGLSSVHQRAYPVLLSQPDPMEANFVSLVNPSAVEEYSTASEKHTGFCYYSPAGDVISDPLFVNFGRPIDFLHVQELFNNTDNIFKGKILIAKQYHMRSSEQYKYASSMQAAGLILYPDPQQYNPDGVKPYPDSQFLPADGVKSDSIYWNGAGDPQSFGLPSLPITYQDDSKLMYDTTIPAQPISAEAAAEIFKHMGGRGVPEDWVGKLNVTYKMGPGLDNDLKLRLRVFNRNVHKTIYDVFGTIPGKTEPDRYIILGHQRDAASHGAFESASGTGTLLELARSLQQLVRTGWQPRRSIMFASFGAEEFNLIGSTEWVEEMEKILSARSVLYINVNKLVSGGDALRVIASPLLYQPLYRAAFHTQMPSSQSVYDFWMKSYTETFDNQKLVLNANGVNSFVIDNYKGMIEYLQMVNQNPQTFVSIFERVLKSAMNRVRPKIGHPDTRDTYNPFLTIAGIPTMSIQLVARAPQSSKNLNAPEKLTNFYPLEHTQYDKFDVYERFIDPGFEKHHVVAKLIGQVVVDVSSQMYLDFNLLDYAQQLRDFLIRSISMHNNFLKEHYENRFQKENFTLLMVALENAIMNFTINAVRLHDRESMIYFEDFVNQRRTNDQLMYVERHFLDYRGIPSNNLKKHIVLSPADSFNSFDSFETEGLFPALSDEMTEFYVFKQKFKQTFTTILKHLPILIQSIRNAAASLTYPQVIYK